VFNPTKPESTVVQMLDSLFSYASAGGLEDRRT
jgi:hypothetical protein